MEQNSKFDKVMGSWDILVIAFGAMIGWGWVISNTPISIFTSVDLC